MALRSSGKTLSFEILSRGNSLGDDEALNSDLSRNGVVSPRDKKANKHKKKKKNKKNRKKNILEEQSSSSIVIPEDPLSEQKSSNSSSSIAVDNANGTQVNCQSYLYGGEGGGSAVVTVVEDVAEAEQAEEKSVVSVCSYGELRQRSVNGGGSVGNAFVENESVGGRVVDEEEVNSTEKRRKSESNVVVNGKLETAESLDWKRLMAEDPNFLFSAEKSPVKYFIDGMYNGNSLRSTTTLGNEKERERVYDTIFRLPWRCELLIDVGFFVCLDSFLSLLTIMPTRIVMQLWSFLNKRQFKKPSAAELADFGCFVVLACGVALLQRTDISLIYHMIRGQGTIKLYVVYNVLEIFDKLCQSFGGDVLQTLFNSAEGLANCSPDNMGFWIWRFIFDEALTMASSILHSFVLLAQAITLSTCIVAHNNALLALLVSNNFAEIKSNVFKRFSRDNIHGLVYSDSVERFHISAFLLFVLAQNILEAEGPWFESFVSNALLVFFCEMLIDIIKHSFLAKFNDIKPTAYSEFLEDLCKQTLNIQTETGKKNLTFVPLAPACVVIRVLTPVYAARLPYNPLPWRIFWILLLTAITYIMLTSLKIMIGMSLQKHATWYVNRCRRRKHHLHSD